MWVQPAALYFLSKTDIFAALMVRASITPLPFNLSFLPPLLHSELRFNPWLCAHLPHEMRNRECMNHRLIASVLHSLRMRIRFQISQLPECWAPGRYTGRMARQKGLALRAGWKAHQWPLHPASAQCFYSVPSRFAFSNPPSLAASRYGGNHPRG